MTGARARPVPGPTSQSRGSGSAEVDDYIASSPAAVRAKLRSIRAAIRSAAPGADEVVSYRMPGFTYPGYSYRGMFVWFAAQRQHIGLYLRPPTIADHRRELSAYSTTKSAIPLPIDEDVPVALIRRLVRASVRNMKQREPGIARKARRRG